MDGGAGGPPKPEQGDYQKGTTEAGQWESMHFFTACPWAFKGDRAVKVAVPEKEDSGADHGADGYWEEGETGDTWVEVVYT